MDLPKQSTLINIQVKLTIIFFWFCVLAPISIVMRFFCKFTLARKNKNCVWFVNWPAKFFYSGTAMMLILFFPSSYIACLAELWYYDFGSAVEIMGFTFAIIIAITCLVMLISTWILNLDVYFQNKNIMV